MKAYIQAVEQIKQDLLAEYGRIHPEIAPNDILKESPNCKVVLDNVEIAIRNSAKQKIFSQRIRGFKKSRLEEEELVPVYITTDDEDSYHDSLDSVSCSKKILYFLFILRYENFGIAERGRYSDRLHKPEIICPEKSIQIYNVKKQILNYMDEGMPTYGNIQPLVKQYLQAIHTLLTAQKQIYQCEFELNQRFIKYLKDSAQQDLFTNISKVEASTVKALIQVLTALRKRGLDIAEIKGKLKSETIEEVSSQLGQHLQNLQHETQILLEVTVFLDDIIKHLEDPRKYEESKDKKPGETEEAGLMDLIKDGFSSVFTEWLTRK